MAKKKPNKFEKEHMNRVAQISCVACRSLGYDTPQVELHHVNAYGMALRASHEDVIPLCHIHHRTGGYGVAIHAGKQAWEEEFGSEGSLLILTRVLLDG